MDRYDPHGYLLKCRKKRYSVVREGGDNRFVFKEIIIIDRYVDERC